MGEWTKILTPIINKFEVGANFGDKVCFNKDGSRGMAMLLKEMAEKLDTTTIEESEWLRRVYERYGKDNSHPANPEQN